MIVVRVWLVTLVVLASTLGAVGSTAPARADDHVYLHPDNIALAGTVTQSSTASGGWTADKAIDGNVGAWDGPDGTPLVTRTNFDVNAWWHLDLGSVESIPEIKVWRTEFQPILENFSVFVSDVPFASTDITITRNQAGVTEYFFGASPDCSQATADWWCQAEPFERIAHNGTGRYIRVQTHGQSQLTLAEVEVGGPFDEISPAPAPRTVANPQVAPQLPWGFEDLGPSLSTKEDQEVWAIEQIGGTIYVGGRYLTVTNTRFNPGSKVVHDQPYLAAFDATTGEFIDFWRPELDGAVFALEASPDGSKLFVGGEFTSVDGIPHTSGLVALDPQTGHVVPTWRASLEKRLVIGPPTVRNLDIDGGWLYVVGNFTNAITFPNLSPVSVKNAIRVSTATGSIDSGWKPLATGGAVWGVGVDASRSRVYLAGKFTSVNGTPNSAWFHTVNTTNGASVAGLKPFTFIHSQRDQRDVVVAGDRVWVGGAQHYLQMLDATDLTLLRGFFTGNGPPPGGLSGGGDTQDIELVGDRIYTTCHCWLNDGVGSKLWEYVPGSVNRPLDYAYGNMAFDAQTGDYISQFGSEPDDFSGVLGGWAVHGAPDGCVWIGGDFITSGQPLPSGLMRQCPLDGFTGINPPPITEAPADTTKPSTPTGVTAVERTNQQVEISWNASSDNDAVAGYYVYRDGQQIIGTAGTKLRYTEIPGVTHQWTVRAIDPSGNLSNLSASTGPFSIAIPAGYPNTYLHENFDPSAGLFSYSDDTFRGTSEPDYVEGVYDTTGGKSNGGAGVRVGGVDDLDIFGMSGGWSATLNLASPTDLELSFKTRVEIASAYEFDEWIEALVSVDGTLYGVPPNDWVVQIDGGCTTCTVSWATYVLDLGTVGAGSHTVTIGAYNNRKTTETESGQVAIDDVQIASPAPGVALTNPVDGDVVAGLVTIGVGADDLEDAAGTLDVDVRINGGSWQQASWDAGLGVYTLLWNTAALAEGPATVEARAADADGNVSATPVADVTINNDNQAPTATITNPSNGATVGGTIIVRVDATDAEDDPGTLDVEVDTGQGWQSTTWNAGNQRYEYSWDTTQQSDGAKTVQARATDSNSAQTDATSIGVTVENVDLAPTATIATPQDGVTWSGARTVRVNATDAEDAAGTLTVQVDVGSGWQPTVWNPGNQRYEYAWDTTTTPDGPAIVKARATDSGSNTTNATDRNITIDNIDAAPAASISAPSEGATVSGAVTVRVNATDPEDALGTLDVDVNVGNGWQSASWNAGTQRYEYTWATTSDPDGPAVVQARATDSGANTTSATSRNVTIQNTVNAPPTVQLVTPAPNTVISGDYSIRIEAHDAEDADETLTVEVNYGTGWVPATWNSYTKLFHVKVFSIDEGLPDGPFVMKARVTDSANQTSQTADVPMNISNSSYARSVLDDKPVMYWRFNETDGEMAGDSRKANSNGVYNGVNPNSGTLLSDGEPGTAARFDGNDDWVWLPNTKALNLGGPYERRTIELWFRADDTDGRQVLWQEGGYGRGFNIYLAGDRLYAGAWNQVNDDPTTPWPPSFVSYDGIVAGETYYVALAFTSVGDRLRLFVNGALVDSDGGVGNLFAHVARSGIGGVDQGTRFHDGKSNWSGYYFDGKIDEVAVFNRILSAADLVERWEIGSGVG